MSLAEFILRFAKEVEFIESESSSSSYINFSYIFIKILKYTESTSSRASIAGILARFAFRVKSSPNCIIVPLLLTEPVKELKRILYMM